jgi:hypothetical protein
MWQLIHTSAPNGLNPGQTGFCTVARHRGIPPRLVALLEGLSAYDSPAEARPVIFTYRLIAVGNETFGVLSRYCDAGLDYTHRRNHLTHHLVVGAAEMAVLPPPAEVAARWAFWRDAWQEAPQWLENSDATAAALFKKTDTQLPALTWRETTGDAANAARLCPDGAPVDTLLENFSSMSADATTLLLRLFAEAALLLQNGPWSAGWTTQVQPTDNFSQIHWRANSYRKNFSAKNLLDFQLLPTLPIMDTPVARHARTGVPPHKQPRAAISPLLSQRPRQPHLADEELSTNSAAQNPRQGYWIFAGAIGAMIAMGVLVWWFFLKNNAETTAPPLVRASTEHVPAKPVNATLIQNTIAEEMLRRDLEAAIGALNWPRAAELWQKLRASNATSNSRDSDFLARIQRHLADALADTAGRAIADALANPVQQKLIAGRAALSHAREQMAALSATISPATKTRFDKFDAQLQILENLPKMAMPMAFLAWKTPPPPGASAGQGQLPFTSAAMHQFLSSPHKGMLTLTLATFEKLDSPAPVEPQMFTLATTTDYVEKKVLLLRPAAGAAARLHVSPSRNVLQPGAVCIEHFPGKDKDAVERQFFTRPNLFLALASDNATVVQLFVSTEKPPPAIISTRIILEGDTTNGPTLPRWLRNVTGERFQIPNTELVLLPSTDPIVAPHLPTGAPREPFWVAALRDNDKTTRRCLPVIFFQ